MNMMVSAAAMTAATMTVQAQAAAPADPIFAAIKKHRVALQALDEALKEHSALDRELPLEKCRSSCRCGELTIVETDDPRWIACIKRVESADGAETEAACELTSERPTSTQGLLRLLQYANEHVEAGHEWPTDLIDDEDDRSLRGDWHYFLLRSVAEAVAELRLSA